MMLKKLFNFFMVANAYNKARRNNLLATQASDSYPNKLVKTDNNYSIVSFFLFMTTIVGIILLIVPIFALCIEVWFNHTITTDLTGMAAYITSVVGVFSSGGFTYAWSRWSTNKYGDGERSAAQKHMSESDEMQDDLENSPEDIKNNEDNIEF